MLLSSIQPLSRLPFEILSEISARLDKKSLKSFRLACVDPAVSAATGAPLFDTVALRLGTLDWSLGRAKSQPLDLIDLNCANAVKILVIDTRHPYVVHEELCDKRYRRFMDKNYEFRNQMDPSDERIYESKIPEWEFEAFLELVESFVEAAENLQTIHWRTSREVTEEFHTQMASLLCGWAAVTGCRLGITLSLRESRSMATGVELYLQNLSNLHHFYIESSNGEEDGIYFPKGFDRVLIDVITRSPNLKSFGLDYSLYWLTDERHGYQLHGALDTFSGMEQRANEYPFESLKLKAHWNIIEGTNWGAMRNLKSLNSKWCIGNGFRENDLTHSHLDKVYASGHMSRLDRFVTNVYTLSTHRFLQRPDLSLTELRLTLNNIDIENSRLAKQFWQEAFPKCALTLLRFKVHNVPRPIPGVIIGNITSMHAWNWLDERDNDAKIALRYGSKIQELSIAFCRGTDSFITELIEDLVYEGSSLRVLNMVFEIGKDLGERLDVTEAKLESWRSTDEVFHGRSFVIRYKRRLVEKRSIAWVRKWRQFPARAAEGFEPLVWFDYILQSWKLSSDKDGVSQLVRQNDEFCFDDKLKLN
ncbi:hypothetical protein H072_11109 [Dactylellina haptotyla CBS 200.50]|uniref:F-box domain-containing protein n=1 Tax=Dactylellina haptotyla (strain CBS 200.50) TaxID=1284197 RepID=S8A313_DACHA|nr:hypothetical protein H072_11109 [Dactylellina haptotyla CBS 200.50]